MWGLNFLIVGYDYFVFCGWYCNDKWFGGGGGGKREERELDVKKCYDVNGLFICNMRK